MLSASILFATLSIASTALATTTITTTNKADVSTSYLPNIVNGVTGSSVTACQPFEDAITACVNAGDKSNQALAACSCSTSFLKSLSACALSQDTMNNNRYASGQYSGFCQQCVTTSFQKANFCPQAEVVHDIAPSPAVSSSTSTPSTTLANLATSASTSGLPSSSTSASPTKELLSTSSALSSATSTSIPATTTPAEVVSSITTVSSASTILPSSTFTIIVTPTASLSISTIIDSPSSTVIVDIPASPTASVVVVDDTTTSAAVDSQVFVDAASSTDSNSDAPQETLLYSSAGKMNTGYYGVLFGLVGAGLLF